MRETDAVAQMTQRAANAHQAINEFLPQSCQHLFAALVVKRKPRMNQRRRRRAARKAVSLDHEYSRAVSSRRDSRHRSRWSAAADHDIEVIKFKLHAFDYRIFANIEICP